MPFYILQGTYFNNNYQLFIGMKIEAGLNSRYLKEERYTAIAIRES